MKKKPPALLESEENIVNLTPLIDVLFVVLISFILITPMLQIDSITLTETNRSYAALTKRAPVSIYLKKDGSVMVNSQPVNLQAFEKILREKEDKTISLQLYPDKQVAFYQYQKVKDTIQAAGFKELDIVVKPE